MNKHICFGFVKVKRPGQQFFSHVGTEPPLPGYLPALWGNLKCLAQGHYTAIVGFKPLTSSSGVRRSYMCYYLNGLVDIRIFIFNVLILNHLQG